MKSKFIIFLLVIALFCACDNNDSFTASKSNLLTFAVDTVSLDTVFSNIPTSTKSFWIYNNSGDGIRCASVKLESGNQSGFRVNVNGIYLGGENGYQTTDLEVRDGDSIRVYVELTSNYTNRNEPIKVQDNIIFNLESGGEQRINLNAYSWDATMLHDLEVKKDTTISGSKPIIIYGGITVEESATLTLEQGTTLYFHPGALVNVYGTLVCNGTAGQNVTLRGDRLDNMFDYLPYDGVSGQWGGVRLHSSSYDNKILYTDIHGTNDGLVVDSSDVNREKLTLESSTVHNCQGYGLNLSNSMVNIYNSQITNTLKDCLYIKGGKVDIRNCTIAQFYPFDSNRGVALRFGGMSTGMTMSCVNTLVTGYADDELMAEGGYDEGTFNYAFDHCLIRTPRVETADSVHLTNVIYEDVTDTIASGYRNFVKIDGDNQSYNFHLSGVSKAIGNAAPSTWQYDRDGSRRDDEPDIGAYEYKK